MRTMLRIVHQVGRVLQSTLCQWLIGAVLEFTHDKHERRWLIHNFHRAVVLHEGTRPLLLMRREGQGVRHVGEMLFLLRDRQGG